MRNRAGFGESLGGFRYNGHSKASTNPLIRDGSRNDTREALGTAIGLIRSNITLLLAPCSLLLRRPVLLLAILPVLVPERLLAQTSIAGRVMLPKTRSTPVINKRYEIVARGGVLSANPPVAVVYLEGSFPAPATQPVAAVTQKDLTFSPALLPVRVGTRVEFPNLDDTYHNIFSFSPAKRFDLGRYRSEDRPIPSQVFDAPGLVTLRCDIHEHMRALILVLDTPYFVLTEPDGRFRIEGIPPGRYVLKAWLDSRNTRQAPVELVQGTALEVNFP